MFIGLLNEVSCYTQDTHIRLIIQLGRIWGNEVAKM